MPSPAKLPGKLRLLALFMILVAVIVIGIAIFSNGGSPVARSPSGDTIKLERYAFQPGTVRYELFNGLTLRVLSKVLPAGLQKKIKWLKPQVSAIVSPAFRNEPLLSAAFDSWDASGKPSRQLFATRLVVSDDRGQEFDSALNALGNGGVFEASAFPRRGKQLRLQLMNVDHLVAEFKIPNPCPGPHPRWKAEPLPVVLTNAGIEVVLEEFTADHDQLKTQCVFLIRENGKESTAWLPSAFEVSDATGNHWRPAPGSPQKASTGNRLIGWFLGALWPEEDAWKLRVEFKPSEKDSKSKATWAVEFLAKPGQTKRP